MSSFNVFKSAGNGQFYFNLTAGNNEIILQSEGYVTKQGCLNGVESVRSNSQDDSKYHRKESSNGQHYFVLKAGNGEIIGKSEMYQSKQGMENGIASVKKNAPTAPLKDNSN